MRVHHPRPLGLNYKQYAGRLDVLGLLGLPTESAGAPEKAASSPRPCLSRVDEEGSAARLVAEVLVAIQ